MKITYLNDYEPPEGELRRTYSWLKKNKKKLETLQTGLKPIANLISTLQIQAHASIKTVIESGDEDLVCEICCDKVLLKISMVDDGDPSSGTLYKIVGEVSWQTS